jgi:hypothetical protein
VPDRTDVDGDAQQATAATSLTMAAFADTARMLILPIPKNSNARHPRKS